MSHSTMPCGSPQVSVGLPVFNGAAWLSNALDSLLAQSFGDFELIISDNASSDATQSICEQYAAQDARIRYVRQTTNQGLVWNFNRVFELSSSPYFKWACYDDIYDPKFLECCVEVLDRDPEVAWCHTRSRHINASGALLLGDETPEVSYLAETVPPMGIPGLPTRASIRPSDRFRAVILGSVGCLDSYGLIRSEIMRKTPLFLPYFGSEKVFMAELALWGRYHEVPQSLCFVRAHDKAAGSMRSRRQQRQCINPTAKVWQSDRLGLLCGYVAAVRRAKLPAKEKLHCYAAIGQYLLQFRKWKSVVRKALTGAGLAAEYPSLTGQSPGTTAASMCESNQ